MILPTVTLSRLATLCIKTDTPLDGFLEALSVPALRLIDIEFQHGDGFMSGPGEDLHEFPFEEWPP